MVFETDIAIHPLSQWWCYAEVRGCCSPVCVAQIRPSSIVFKNIFIYFFSQSPYIFFKPPLAPEKGVRKKMELCLYIIEEYLMAAWQVGPIPTEFGWELLYMLDLFPVVSTVYVALKRSKWILQILSIHCCYHQFEILYVLIFDTYSSSDLLSFEFGETLFASFCHAWADPCLVIHHLSKWVTCVFN